jgi:arylsulfatase A-like enzyme
VVALPQPRYTLGLALVLALLWPGALLAAQSAPNILVLMAEDMGLRVGAFGDPVAVTPNLDQLAQHGVKFDRVFTTAGVCAPSRAAHILGMHQIATGTQHMRTASRAEGSYYSVPPAMVKAYPELLRRHGYYTFTDSKLDYQFSGIGADSGPSTIWDDAGVRDWSGRHEGQPFYGLINFEATHESGLFAPLGSMPHGVVHLWLQLRRWWRDADSPPQVVTPDQVEVPPYYPDTETVRTTIARQYNNIALMDQQVGQVLDKLRADGLADSTIVIWTTDHGDGLPRAKRELYDTGIHVPMIVHWPAAYRPDSMRQGATDSRLISFVDLAPTVLAMAGVDAPDYLHGHDVFNTAVPPRRYVFASRDRVDEQPDRQRAARDQRYKYIRSWHPELPGGHPLAFRENMDMVREMNALQAQGKLSPAQGRWFEPVGRERLYDLSVDPHELHDPIPDKHYAEALQRMREALDTWIGEVGDWSEESETDMVARFMPGNSRQVTPAPVFELAGGAVTLKGVKAGLSLAFRVDEGRWQLYTQPIPAASVNERIQAKAVRYGWQESEVVEFRPTEK